MQIIIKKVKTSKRVSVEIGEKGAIPNPRVKIILLRNAKGVYIRPTLLEVF